RKLSISDFWVTLGIMPLSPGLLYVLLQGRRPVDSSLHGCKLEFTSEDTCG
ncbi:hypothetical protein L9F63_023344, partial [Diploptera punctata]